MNQLGYTPPAELSRVSLRALIVGVVLTILLLIGASIKDPAIGLDPNHGRDVRPRAGGRSP